MNRERSMTAFYLETILMVIIFVLVILIMTKVLGLAALQSSKAKELTNAVCLAQNAAEAVAASSTEEELLKLLDEDGNAALEESADGAVLSACYSKDLEPVKAGEGTEALRLEVSWQPEQSGGGTFVSSDINVYAKAEGSPVYTLNTGVYLQKQEGGR